MPENRLTGATGVDTSIYRLPEQANPLERFGQMAGIARQIIALDSDQFGLAQRRLDAMHGIASSVAADPSQDNVMRRAAEARALGLHGEVDRAMEEFRQAGFSPEAVKRVALRHLGNLADVRQRLELAGMGAPQLVDDGDRKLPITMKSGLGAGVYPAGGAPIANRLGPRERVQTQESVDPRTGAPRATPLGELYDSRGNLRAIPVRRGGAGSPGAAAGAPPPAGTPQADAAASGSFTTGLSPATAADIKGSAEAFAAARDDIEPSRDRAYGLTQAIGALRGTTTGLGTEGRQKLLNFINALPGGAGKALVPDSAALSDFDLANKYLAAVQMGRAGAGRSDAALRTSAAASLNTAMTKPAAIEAATSLLGQERMRQAHILDYLAGKRDPGEFATYRSTTYGGMSDPKAYALGVMTPGERAKYANGLTGEARARFLASVRLGLKTGVLSRDDLGGAGGQ